MTDLVEKVAYSMHIAATIKGDTLVPVKMKTMARAAIAAVLDDLEDPTDFMIESACRPIYGVDPGEQEARALWTIQQMIRVKRREVLGDD